MANEAWLVDELMKLKSASPASLHGYRHAATGVDPVTIDASQVTTGTFDASRIPTLDASRIPNLDATKITSGVFDIARIPRAALETLITVQDDAARFALTPAQAQYGDSVYVINTEKLYFVVDTTKLSSEDGYYPYTVSVQWSSVLNKPSAFPPTTASASSIGGVKVGAGLAIAADGTLTATGGGSVEWNNITGKPSAFPPSSHSHSATDIIGGTISPSQLPAATASSVGAVKVGSGLTVSADGTLSVGGSGTNIVTRQTYEGEDVLYYTQLTHRTTTGNRLDDPLKVSAQYYRETDSGVRVENNYTIRRGPYQCRIYASAGYYPMANYHSISLTNIVCKDTTAGITLWTQNSAYSQSDTPLDVGDAFYAEPGHTYSITYHRYDRNEFTSDSTCSVKLDGDASEIPCYLCVVR